MNLYSAKKNMQSYKTIKRAEKENTENNVSTGV